MDPGLSSLNPTSSLCPWVRRPDDTARSGDSPVACQGTAGPGSSFVSGGQGPSGSCWVLVSLVLSWHLLLVRQMWENTGKFLWTSSGGSTWSLNPMKPLLLCVYSLNIGSLCRGQTFCWILRHPASGASTACGDEWITPRGFWMEKNTEVQHLRQCPPAHWARSWWIREVVQKGVDLRICSQHFTTKMVSKHDQTGIFDRIFILFPLKTRCLQQTDSKRRWDHQRE